MKLKNKKDCSVLYLHSESIWLSLSVKMSLTLVTCLVCVIWTYGVKRHLFKIRKNKREIYVKLKYIAGEVMILKEKEVLGARLKQSEA